MNNPIHFPAFLPAMVLFISTVPGVARESTWQGMLGDLVTREKAGFGGLCGIAVDPENGTVWINVSDRGFFKSLDQAKSFKRCGDKQPKGRTESPGCFLLDPTRKTKTLLTALVYGSPISTSLDEGISWKSRDSRSTHMDWCALDWTDPERKFMIGLKHESEGLLLASQNSGVTFDEVGKGYGPGWVFDSSTAVVTKVNPGDSRKSRLLRTTDGAKTWHFSGNYSPAGLNSAQALPIWRDGTVYWLVEDALIASSDKGVSWNRVAEVKGGRYGPVFGKDKSHMFILTGTGVIESSDSGSSWSRPIPGPIGIKDLGGLAWLAYDPKGDVMYLMKMGSDLFRFQRGKTNMP